jgi:hypothetical protein
MDLEIVGHHSLLFDDDVTADAVNSGGSLVPWAAVGATDLATTSATSSTACPRARAAPSPRPSCPRHPTTASPRPSSIASASSTSPLMTAAPVTTDPEMRLPQV